MSASNVRTKRLPKRSSACKSARTDRDSKSELNKDNFQNAFAEHEKYKMNLARIKRKKIPVIAGRSNALPPLDAIDERDKSERMQGEGYSTMNDKVKEAPMIAAQTTKAHSKSIMASKQTT